MVGPSIFMSGPIQPNGSSAVGLVAGRCRVEASASESASSEK